MLAKRYHSFFVYVIVIFFLVLSFFLHTSSTAVAEISTDGSLGPKTLLAGPNYQIPDTLGQIRGSTNLFHSFDKFNIETGYSATFTGPNGIRNIISRVTGGSPSSIDGLLSCTIDGANLYLLNPSGVMFGPSASLDVKGSFHVSTADYLKFSNGDVFYANPASSSVLSVADPQAFGFLSANPASISLDQSFIQVPEGQTLSIIGGNITPLLDTSSYSLSAPGGRINLVSVASPGEVDLSAPDLGMNSFSALGNITLSNGANLNVSSSDYSTPAGLVIIRGGQIVLSNSGVDAVGNPSGTIDIRGDAITLDNSYLNVSDNYSYTPAGIVVLGGGQILLNQSTINAYGSPGGTMDIQGNALNLNNSTLDVSSSDYFTPAGSVIIRGGPILFNGSTINAYGNPGGTIDMRGEALTLDSAYLFALGMGDADHASSAVNIDVANNFIMKNYSWINSTSYGTGRGGDIRINAGNITLGDDVPAAIGNLIQSGSLWSPGPGGNISITSAGDVVLKNGFSITAGTGDQGNAGKITIQAGNEFVMKNESFIDSSTNGAGRGGDIHITARNITLGDDTPGIPFVDTYDFTNPYGCIRSWSYASGQSGDIHISANNNVVVKNGFYIGTAALDQGNAGNVTVNADTVRLIDQGNIFSNAFTSGMGGIVDVTARDILISAANEAAVISTQQITGIGAQTGGAANGGKITVNTDSLQLLDGGQISTVLIGSGHGADVEVTAKNILISGFVLDPALTPVPYGLSGIDARVVGAMTVGGTGGNIAVTADNLNVANGGVIRTNLFEDAPGKAGNITVNAGTININSGGQIYADSFRGTGDSGDLTIKANILSITGFGGSQAPYPVPDFTGLSTTTNAGTGGTINVSLMGDLSITAWGGIKADTQGIGSGGAINISAQNVFLSDNSTINSASTGTGNAGNIAVTAANSVQLTNSSITTEAMLSDGGNIQIITPYMLSLTDSKITASVGGGPQTTGGNIFIDPQYVILKNSQIIANAYEGQGGNIQIFADVFLADPLSVVDASSALGISGTVDIEASITNVYGLLTPLSTEFVSATALLRERCIARLREGKYSSFVIGGRDGLPIEPGNFLPGMLQ